MTKTISNKTLINIGKTGFIMYDIFKYGDLNRKLTGADSPDIISL